jgi:hypothetical protein
MIVVGSMKGISMQDQEFNNSTVDILGQHKKILSNVFYGKLILTGAIFTIVHCNNNQKYITTGTGAIHRIEDLLFWNPIKKEWVDSTKISIFDSRMLGKN